LLQARVIDLEPNPHSIRILPHSVKAGGVFRRQRHDLSKPGELVDLGRMNVRVRSDDIEMPLSESNEKLSTNSPRSAADVYDFQATQSNRIA
jgi:hypothetical protein